jgi:hypothetical protein
MDEKILSSWIWRLDQFTKGMVRRRQTRLIMTDSLLGKPTGTLQSTKELDTETVTALLDSHFPDWRIVPFDPQDYPSLITLARLSNTTALKMYGDPAIQYAPNPDKKKHHSGRSPEAKTRRKERIHAKRQSEFEARESKRQAKHAAQQILEQIPSIQHTPPQESILERATKNLDKLNAWRAKAGLPPVNEVQS